MEKVQRFGSAMLAPVLLFAVAGLAVALAIIAQNEQIFGSLAADGTWWSTFWGIWEAGSWTVFNQMELLFVLGLPIALAKMANARAVLETAMIYLTFNYFVGAMLEAFGDTFGVDYSAEAGGESGLKMIAGIKTLDTGILGAIFIAAIAVWIHNRYFEKKLPEFLGIFQGSQYVYAVGMLLMIPLALLVCLVWPQVQLGIASLQGFLVSSGAIGVGLYTFLERILIPTGLHHFVYSPFIFGPAVVPEGIQAYWIQHIETFSASTSPLKELFPGGGFALHGNSKVFAPLGIAAAFYTTAKAEKRKETLALLIPVVLTAVITGITEPLEFTFLFVAPPLFALHAVFAGLMSGLMYHFGLVGNMGGRLIDFFAQNWIPMWSNHHSIYLMQIGIGLTFTALYFVVFRFLILTFNFKTPGREDNADVKLYSKAEYREAKKNKKNSDDTESLIDAPANTKGTESTDATTSDPFSPRATAFLALLGGPDNITSVNNCATRLRVSVADPELVAAAEDFKSAGALGLVNKGKALQVIVGMDVPQVRDKFEAMVNQDA
ncbi:alpha-glucoside-specific PTS transporter subunit IIBC [Corynebacterium uberis]|uniref:alpha-glucoside-specific PTS transporter subunit IIBC n=1 Tax=Corynebacterium uberis TaxID=2883169 RepID=UPI001D0AC240|nr:alpha-glucoside-specific PTS transporter subunit IIBC [Corynebacterium uberis]UDL72882.1 alpha-glucoside-specific PTS transporter subunit IIBC [Corynebacterium uberis]